MRPPAPPIIARPACPPPPSAPLRTHPRDGAATHRQNGAIHQVSCVRSQASRGNPSWASRCLQMRHPRFLPCTFWRARRSLETDQSPGDGVGIPATGWRRSSTSDATGAPPATEKAININSAALLESGVAAYGIMAGLPGFQFRGVCAVRCGDPSRESTTGARRSCAVQEAVHRHWRPPVGG